MKAFKGNIIYTKEFGKLEVEANSYLVVNNGKIVEIVKDLKEYENIETVDFKNGLIIPGFVDIHLHAPQINNIGLGVDLELLDWLNTYTFPEESKYKDLEFAKKSYMNLINKLWENGTTSSVIFGSIYNNSNILLAEMMEKSGLKSYIGKVNMDRNSPEYYIEETKKSLYDTEEFINQMKKFKRSKAIITPRFVPSCTEDLMIGLGDLARKYDLKIQSHLSENRSEINWVKELHPDCENYIDVDEKYGLLIDNKVVMAHCVYSNKKEIDKLKKYNVTVAHAPISNGNIASGIAPIMEFCNYGVNVGLVSDISGGHEINMTKVLTYGETFGKLKWVEEKSSNDFYGTNEYFYMATKGSGNYFGNVGSFEKGYYADFLVIDDNKLEDMNERKLEERFKRFIYLGSSENIKSRYIQGEYISKPFNDIYEKR